MRGSMVIPDFFRRLCDQHRDRIFTYACYWLGNREDAEDATQEVLLRLWDSGQGAGKTVRGYDASMVCRNELALVRYRCSDNVPW